jgi:hypothetical protein
MLVLLVVLVMASLAASAQSTNATAGSITIGVGAEAAIPMGDFSNATSFGIGGLALGSYDIDENLAVNLKAGYLHFSGKDQTVPGGGTASTSYGIIPILIGAKYFFTPAMNETSMRPYGAADVGLFVRSYTAPSYTVGNIIYGGGSTSSTDFGVSPILGARFKAGDSMDVDVHANYTAVFTSGSTISWVGVGLGLVFGLQ